MKGDRKKVLFLISLTLKTQPNFFTIFRNKASVVFLYLQLSEGNQRRGLLTELSRLLVSRRLAL